MWNLRSRLESQDFRPGGDVCELVNHRSRNIAISSSWGNKGLRWSWGLNDAVKKIPRCFMEGTGERM